jgi:exo-1,4-beta-D-glucosaminidase
MMSVAALFFLSTVLIHAQVKNARLELHDGWSIQSSCKVGAKGEVVSTAAFNPSGWYATTVPMTVVAALVNNKVYPDPYYGTNLRTLPGMEYEVGAIFANQPMPEGSPFRCAWWYRTEFRLPLTEKGKKVSLHFDGINYKASIWLNGRQIATPERVAGAYRQYEFEVSEFLNYGKPNVLAVEITAQTENDLGINWVDWNPTPPDKNMGLWRDVYLTTSGPVTVRGTQVTTELDQEKYGWADISVHTELTNLSDTNVTGEIRITYPDHIRMSMRVNLAPGEISNPAIPRKRIKDPHLWWPYQMGKPEMYDITIEFLVGNRVSDNATVHFGIRKVTSELTPQGYRLFKINGKNLLIRGAGWASDMLQRVSAQRQEQELKYVLDMGLNTVRLEGQLETDHFYDLADRMGILVMPGWCCCSRWEEWDKWTTSDKTIATESLRSQLIRIRNHPSVFVWLNGSDNPPKAEIEQAYLDIEKELNWPNPVLSSATAVPTTISGQSGVKMSGPYEYVPPMYWYSDVEKKHGGGYGFNTETSPGPAPPVEESIRRIMPKEHWWPIDDVWGYHAGSGSFKTIDIFRAAMEARYGAAQNLSDFSLRSQVMTYDNERAMFESYSRNKYISTGVIQWMLNNAWPGLIWHLYDYYLVPGGGYFGTKKANEPVHLLYGYDDNAVWVVNNLHTAVNGAKVHVSVMNLDTTEKFRKEADLDIAADSSTQVIPISQIEGLSSTYLVKMELRDATGKLISSNFYWLSTTPETLDWTKTNYYVTPVVQHADLKALNTLPKVRLEATAHSAVTGNESVTRVKVRNPSKTLAFAVELKLKNSKGEMIAPVLWEDNYFALLPGEERIIIVRYGSHEAKDDLSVQVNGWNVEGERVKILKTATRAKKAN